MAQLTREAEIVYLTFICQVTVGYITLTNVFNVRRLPLRQLVVADMGAT